MMSKHLDVSLLLDYYGALLTDKQRELAELYYNEDLSLAEIAELMDITRQGVHDSVRRTETILRHFEEHVGLLRKTEELSRLLAQVSSLASVMKALADSGNAERISQCAEEILHIASSFADNQD